MPKITELSAITALDDDDVLVIVEDGVSKKLTMTELRAAIVPSWTSYTPVLTAVSSNPTLGSGGGASGQYVKIGKLVIVRGAVQFGTSGVGAGSGIYLISLPVAAALGGYSRFGYAQMSDSSGAVRKDGAIFRSNSGDDRFSIFPSDIASSAEVSHSVPWTWAASDEITFFGSYEATA